MFVALLEEGDDATVCKTLEEAKTQAEQMSLENQAPAFVCKVIGKVTVETTYTEITDENKKEVSLF